MPGDRDPVMFPSPPTPPDLPPSRRRPPWAAVEQAGRVVDRQLECVRSIVAAGDPELIGGPVGSVVRRSHAEVLALLGGDPANARPGGTGRPGRPGRSGPSGGRAIGTDRSGAGNGSAASPESAWQGALARCHLAASALAVDLVGPDAVVVLSPPALTVPAEPDRAPVLELLSALGDEVATRYRSLHQATGTPSDGARKLEPGAVGAPLDLFFGQLADLLHAEGHSAPTAVAAMRLATVWLQIGGRVARARSWLEARPAMPAGHGPPPLTERAAALVTTAVEGRRP